MGSGHSQREIQDKSKYLICFLKGISIIDDGKPLILDGSKPKYSKLPGNSELSTNVQVYGSVGKESACNAGDTGDAGLIPGLGRSLGEGNGNPLQYSCLENPMDRGAWLGTVLMVTKSQTRLTVQVQHSINHLVGSDSLQRHGLVVAHQTPLSIKFSRQEYWSG